MNISFTISSWIIPVVITVISIIVYFVCATIDNNNDGYVDKETGEVKYKPQPWYKRLYNYFFYKEPSKTEYLGVATFHTEPSGHQKAAVYRRYNPVTNKTQSVYAVRGSIKRHFNVDVYDDDHKTLIPIE